MVAFPLNPKDLQRILRRMGITVEEVRAGRVVVELEGGGRLVVDEPTVMVVRARGQPPMLQVMGQIREERREEAAGEVVEISEDDVRLVAEQAGVSLDEARRALEETGGDIAAAILKLQGEG